MGIPWRNLGHIALAVVGVMAPQVVVAEQAIEELVRAKGAAKKDAAIGAALEVLKGFEGVTGKNLHQNPKINDALLLVNDALVKLRDELAAAGRTAPSA
jgi:hypothetical protein